jgi:hypothetical protein
VAILHSQRALLANFLKQAKVSCADKATAFARVFEDLGIPFTFIAHEELSAEQLKDFKVLLLPEASALSDDDIKVIREFAAKGGKIIADYEIATLTELCNNREKGALNDLFGIKANRQVLRKVKSHTLDGITIRHAVTGVKLAGGKAAGFAQTQRGKAPLAISTGNTLYLKLPSESDPKFRKVRAIVNMFPGEGIVKVFFADTRKLRGAQAAFDSRMIDELRRVLGDDNVVVK